MYRSKKKRLRLYNKNGFKVNLPQNFGELHVKELSYSTSERHIDEVRFFEDHQNEVNIPNIGKTPVSGITFRDGFKWEIQLVQATATVELKTKYCGTIVMDKPQLFFYGNGQVSHGSLRNKIHCSGIPGRPDFFGIPTFDPEGIPYHWTLEDAKL